MDEIGLRAVDIGELLASAAAGAMLAVGSRGPISAEPAHSGESSRHLLILLGVLVFFGVAVDMVHGALDPAGWGEEALVIMEDGGELVAVSFINWYAFLLLLVAGDPGKGASLAVLVGAAAAHGARFVRSPG